MYIFILFIILFIILFYIINYYSINGTFKESFTESNNNKCTDFLNTNSFCQLNIDSNKCECRYQKDNVKYNFYSTENCCERHCSNLSPEECVKNTEFTKIPYYCNIGGECKEYEGTITDSHISANNCGIDPLNNQLLLPYSTKGECLGTVGICDKYNIPTNSHHVNRSNCLQDVNCGYCNNEVEGGKCVLGQADGPLDLTKYFYCTPYSTTKNTYEYGNHAAYLLQK